MIAQYPNVLDRRYRRLREFGHCVFIGQTRFRILRREQVGQLVEAGQAEIEIRFLDLPQFECEEIHRKGSQDFDDPELARRLLAQMPINNLAVAPNETRNLKSELADRGNHPIDGGITLPWIAGILDEPFDWPVLDALRCGRRDHSLFSPIAPE
ncbi:MAG TPA: hypothetical protein VME17_18990 [Bryobacteraceae bacterium]|nr:hypothetical protein [Bryobacteraceae bacterium]